MLIERLEHIPADSIWAHRASGIRGSLLKLAESLVAGEAVNLLKFDELYRQGFRILEKAAKEKY